MNIEINLPEDGISFLEKLSVEHGISISVLIVEALEATYGNAVHNSITPETNNSRGFHWLKRRKQPEK